MLSEQAGLLAEQRTEINEINEKKIALHEQNAKLIEQAAALERLTQVSIFVILLCLRTSKARDLAAMAKELRFRHCRSLGWEKQVKVGWWGGVKTMRVRSHRRAKSIGGDTCI